MHENQLKECNASKKMLGVIARLLKQASFPGTEASQVHEAFRFIKLCTENLEAKIDELEALVKEAKKKPLPKLEEEAANG